MRTYYTGKKGTGELPVGFCLVEGRISARTRELVEELRVRPPRTENLVVASVSHP